ncbi:MAG: hypothetical protein J7J82_01340 [Staphylothermus sp.]|nr:hypothetical protein [Staphylothermus sp.]
MYELKCKGYIELPKNYDLNLVLSVYNFGFWFDGTNCFLQLDNEGNIVALIDTSGRYVVYSKDKSLKCSDLVDKLVYVLGLNEDLSKFYALAEKDPLLGCFSRKYRGWRVRSTSLWWGLVIGICQQNASFRQGWGMLYNIVKLYGRKAVLNVREYPLIPTPQDILDNPDLLIKARTGYRRETILRVARVIEKIENRIRKEKEPERIESIIKSIKGVGAYTARLAMVLSPRKYELPPIDRWLKKIISTTYGVDEKNAEKYWIYRWKNYSGLAALAVTIALDAVPLRKALERLRNGETCPLKETQIISPINMWKHMK